jgi:hypothetical protein
VPPDVAIEISAADAASPHVATLIEACTKALARGRCALATASEAGDASQATAIVGWEGTDHGRVRIQVGVHRDGQPRWISRELTFRAQDAEVERWRAAGLVVATLAGAAREGEVSEETPAADARDAQRRATQEPPPPAPRDHILSRRGRLEPAAPQSRSTIVIDAAVASGPALDDGTWRVGPSGRLGYALARLPFAAWVGARWGARPRDDSGVSATWTGLTVGVGPWISLASDRVVFAGRVELLGELVSASVVEPETEAVDEGERWMPGARAGIDGAWSFARPLAVVAGVDVSFLRHATVLEVRRQPVARASVVALTTVIGLRVSVPAPW